MRRERGGVEREWKGFGWVSEISKEGIGRERERRSREGGVGEEERYFGWVNAGKQGLGQELVV